MCANSFIQSVIFVNSAGHCIREDVLRVIQPQFQNRFGIYAIKNSSMDTVFAAPDNKSRVGARENVSPYIHSITALCFFSLESVCHIGICTCTMKQSTSAVGHRDVYAALKITLLSYEASQRNPEYKFRSYRRYLFPSALYVCMYVCMSKSIFFLCY